MDGRFRHIVALALIQLFELGDDFVQPLAVRPYRLRVTFIERMSDGQQGLLRHLLRLFQRMRIEHQKMAGA